MPDAPRKGVQSVDVSGALLVAMMELGRPSPLKDIAATAGMPPAKAHRYMTSLGRIGIVMQHRTSGLYGLGPMALKLGLAAIAQHDIIDRATEVLQKLCDHLATSGHLAVWSDRGSVIIRTAHGGPPVISPLGTGTVLPMLRSATGRIFLAFMPEAATKDIVAAERKLMKMSRAEAGAIVEAVRHTGHALLHGKLIPGLCALAMPVFHHDGTLACSITLVTTDEALFTGASAATRDAVDAVARLNACWSAQPARPRPPGLKDRSR